MITLITLIALIALTILIMFILISRCESYIDNHPVKSQAQNGFKIRPEAFPAPQTLLAFAK